MFGSVCVLKKSMISTKSSSGGIPRMVNKFSKYSYGAQTWWPRMFTPLWSRFALAIDFKLVRNNSHRPRSAKSSRISLILRSARVSFSCRVSWCRWCWWKRARSAISLGWGSTTPPRIIRSPTCLKPIRSKPARNGWLNSEIGSLLTLVNTATSTNWSAWFSRRIKKASQNSSKYAVGTCMSLISK